MGHCPSRKSSYVFGAVTETIIMDCDVAAAVDDLVRQDATVDNKVEVATTNTEQRKIIGIISKKITATSCEVILRGVIDFPSVTTRGRLILSSTGGFTTDFNQPRPFFLQFLGWSFGNGKIRLDPDQLGGNLIS